MKKHMQQQICAKMILDMTSRARFILKAVDRASYESHYSRIIIHSHLWIIWIINREKGHRSPNRFPPMHLKSASMRTRGISHWTHKVSDNRGKNVKWKSFTHPSQFTLILLKNMGISPVKEALKSNRHPATHIKSTPLKHYIMVLTQDASLLAISFVASI